MSDVVIPLQVGWVCPLCEHVYAPSVATCFNCGKGNRTDTPEHFTDSTNTPRETP